MDDPRDNNISDTHGSLGLGLVVSSPSPPPASSSPQLIHQSETKAIYRLYDPGYKVLLSPDPSDEFAKLVHEQNISNFLPLSCRKRKVIDVTTFTERPALRFQWASGITLPSLCRPPQPKGRHCSLMDCRRGIWLEALEQDSLQTAHR